MVYIQALIQAKKEQFQGLNVDLKEFTEILNKIGEINPKYALDEEVIVQLYNVLYQKQEGNVTIEGIEALILQCLLEEQSYQQKNDQQNDDIDQLEIRSMNHIQLEEINLINTYQHLNFDSINQILFIYNKAAKVAKSEDPNKCQLSFILQQIENLKSQDKLQLEPELAQQIFQMLSCKENGQEFVFNNDLQQYISKYENYVLLNKYGQNNIENYEQAYVFHESEEDCTSCDSQNASQTEINKKDIFENSISSEKKDFVNQNQNNNNQKNQNYQFTSVISSLSNIQDVNSFKNFEKQSRNFFVENNFVQSMRDLYPVLSEFEQKDKQYSGIVDKIQQFYSTLQQEIQNLQQQIYEKDSQIQSFLEIKQMKAQIISQLQKKEEDYISQISYLEEKILKLQENIDQLNKQILILQNKEKEYQVIQQEHDRLVKEVKIKDLEIKELKFQTSNLKKNVKESIQAQEIQEKEILTLKNQIEKSPIESQNSSLNFTERQNIEQLNGIIIHLEDENSQLKMENQKLKDTIQGYVKTIEDNEENNNNLQSEVFTLKKQINEISDSFNSFNDLTVSRLELPINQQGVQKRKSLFNRMSWQNEIQQLITTEKNDDILEQRSLENDLEQINFNGIFDYHGDENDEQSDTLQNQLKINRDSIEEEDNVFGNLMNVSKNKGENQQQNSFNSKRISDFNYAALEIIQSYQKLQTKRDVNDYEQTQKISPNISIIRIQSTPSTNVQLNQEDYMKSSITKADQNKNIENKDCTQENITPSFQQVLKGDTNFYWNQLNKQLFSNHKNTYNQQLTQNEDKIPQNRKLITVRQFNELQDSSQQKENPKFIHSFSLPQQNQVINSDNLNLKQDARIIQIRKTFETNQKKNLSENTLNIKMSLIKNEPNQSLQYFYSDSIYRINAQNEKERRILCITSQYVYIINPTDNFKLVRKFQVRLINRITFSNMNSNLCVIHVLNQSDYVIESCRRFELNIFLKNLFKSLELPTYMISFAENLLIRSKKKEKIFQSPEQLAATPNLQNDQADTEMRNPKTIDQQINKQAKAVNQNLQDKVMKMNSIQSNTNITNKSNYFNIQMKINQNIFSNFLFNPWKSYFLEINDTKAIIYKDQKVEVKVIEVSLIGATINEETQNKEKILVFQIKNQTNPIQIKTNDPKEYELLLNLVRQTPEN